MTNRAVHDKIATDGICGGELVYAHAQTEALERIAEALEQILIFFEEREDRRQKNQGL